MGHIGRVSSTADYAEQLRVADLRVTRPRVAVLEAVHVHPHADTETIFAAVRNGLPVVCRSCGVIADIDCAVGDAPCLTPSDDNNVLDGFVLDEAEVIYWGLCPDCSTPVSRSQS